MSERQHMHTHRLLCLLTIPAGICGGKKKNLYTVIFSLFAHQWQINLFDLHFYFWHLLLNYSQIHLQSLLWTNYYPYLQHSQ